IRLQYLVAPVGRARGAPSSRSCPGCSASPLLGQVSSALPHARLGLPCLLVDGSGRGQRRGRRVLVSRESSLGLSAAWSVDSRAAAVSPAAARASPSARAVPAPAAWGNRPAPAAGPTEVGRPTAVSAQARMQPPLERRCAPASHSGGP